MISNIWLSINIYYFLTNTETAQSFSIQRRPGTNTNTLWTSSPPKLSRIKHSVLHVTVTDKSNNHTSTGTSTPSHKVFGILTTSRTKAATSPSRNRRTSLFFSKSSVEIKNEIEDNINHTHQTKNNSKYAITKDRHDQSHDNDVITNNVERISSDNDQADDSDIINNINDFNESLTSHHDRDDRSKNKNSSINNETHSSTTSNINNGDHNKKKQDKAYDPLSSWTDWSTSTSLGSFLLKRKKIEEEEMKKIQDLTMIDDYDNDNDMIYTTKDNKNTIPTVPMDIDQTLKSLASEAEGTFVSFIDLTTGKKDKENVKKKKKAKDDAIKGLDKELIREVEESVTILSATQQNLMRDIDVLPFSVIPLQQQKQQQRSTSSSFAFNEATLTMLPLSDEAHTARIEKDIKHLSVSIASTIDDAEQWKRFTEDGGGLLPLLECIRDGATEIDRGAWENSDFYEEGMIGLVEKRDEAFATACKACKTLRDLCAISKPFAAIITDSILRADAVWSTPMKKENGDVALQDGLISNLITLLRFSLQADNLYNRRSRRQKIRALRNRGVQRMGSRKQKRGEYHLPLILFN